MRREDFRVNHFRFHFSSSKPFLVSLDLNELYPPCSYTIRRLKLDHELLRLAREEGAMVLEGNRFTGLERDGDGGWKVSREDSGERVRSTSAAFLIGADGAPSSVALSLGSKTRSNGLKGWPSAASWVE
ncbi:MAG: FAD-dependent monooxygenase [Actinomycetota bacterium]|nr:FAD-dependent monooxygenase [Actinomycetota bacterium]